MMHPCGWIVSHHMKHGKWWGFHPAQQTWHLMLALFQLTTSGVLWSGSLRKCGVYQMVVKSRNVQLKHDLYGSKR